MIYLIGGSPRCGKTTLAQFLSRQLSIPWLATDTLESIVSECISSSDFNKMFPKSVTRRQTKKSNDVMYTEFTPKQIARAHIKQSRAVWKAISMLVSCELYEGRSFILEGYHIHPKLVSMLKKKYGSKNIKAIFLTKTNVKNIIKGSINYSSKTDWFVQKTNDPKIYVKVAEMIAELGNFFQGQAKKHRLKILEMDSSFKANMRLAEKYFLDRVK